MSYRILVVDDSEEDVFFFKRAMAGTGLDVQLTCITDSSLGFESIQNETFDCVFMDYYMPGADGLYILQEVRRKKIHTPVIMLTGQKDEQIIVKLMKEGATDYLSKDGLSSESLRISIENAKKIYRIEQQKIKAELALRSSEARLAEAQRIAHIGNWEYHLTDRSFLLSDEARSIIGLLATENVSLLNFSRKIHRADFMAFKEALHQLQNFQPYDITIRYFASDKQEKSLNIKGRPSSHNKSIGTIQDVTVLKTALLNTQKAAIKSKATSIVLVVAIIIFLLSEAVLDPFIDSLTASLLISLSFKGSIAVALKPIEVLLEKIMMSRRALSV